MKDINLPPFYVGQRVVTLIRLQEAKIKKGTIVTVLQMMQCKCRRWLVDIGIKENDPFDIVCECRRTIDNGVVWIDSKLLAPIEENFETISYEKVRELESPLINAN